MNKLGIRGLSALAVLMLPFSAAGQGVDWMVMVNQYGDNIFNTLHTEIMIGTQRQAMGQAGAAEPRVEQWPAHIVEGGIAGHVFTIYELIAMRHSDRDRMYNLLHGRVISVEGYVRIAPRADSSFRLVAPDDEGYNVWAYWRSYPGALPEHGSYLRVTGTAEMERNTYLTIREGQVSAAAPPAGPVSAGRRLAPAQTASLTFTPSPEIAELAMQYVADALAPVLAPGVTREDMLGALRSGELQQGFAQALVAEGFSVTDLGDVMAGHLILAWQLANDRPDLQEPAGYQVIRSGVRDALLQADWTDLLPDEDKQLLAEILGLGVMVIASRYIHGYEVGDSAIVAAAAEDARQMVLGYGGIDLRALDLTPQGFVGR